MLTVPDHPIFSNDNSERERLLLTPLSYLSFEFSFLISERKTKSDLRRLRAVHHVCLPRDLSKNKIKKNKEGKKMNKF